MVLLPYDVLILITIRGSQTVSQTFFCCSNYVAELEAGVDWGALADSLSSLSLSNNHLVALGEGALVPLRRLVHLDLEGNRLHVVAAGALPPSLALLRLSENLLPALPCAAMARLPRLRHLHLRNNPLRPAAAAERAFCRAAISRVDSLDLSQNDLDDLFALDVQRLQLRRLILDLNDFTSIPAFAVEGGRLERLSMCHNRLVRVSDATLHALEHLERLELDHNELTTLGAGARGLARLRHLSLAYNQLEDVDHLPPRLVSLVLAGNLLARFPAGLRVVAPATLVHLELGYNRIVSVSARDFGPWAGVLATLGLKGNRVAELAADAFPAALPLRELALGFNELYRVEPAALTNLTRLRVLELSAAGGALPPAPPALVWLALDNSDLYRVSAQDLADFASLEYLNLDFNRIVEFPSDADEASPIDYKLKELRLSYNYINEVNGEFLQNLVELESLDLSYNRLRNVSEAGFANLLNLVYLSLAGNIVEKLADGAFRRLPRLAALDLSDNSLFEFSTRPFMNVSSDEVELTVNVSHNRIAMLLVGDSPTLVHALDLSHNRLESVPAAFFATLTHLRRLTLAHNQLTAVDGASFGALPNLLVLNLNDNRVGVARRRAFADMPALRILDLSRNRLAQLAAEQFHGLRELRHLQLDENELRALPRDCFQGTLLEHLDLAGNRLTVYPSSALAQVGFTLRRLELARNKLEYLDAAMFRATAFLHELGLAANSLTALADNTFVALARLQRLDLSGNMLKANFKEVFHALPRLRRLALADAGLRAVPPLPLANLTELDLSGNGIASYREGDVRRLPALRRLDLARNRLTSLQPAMWAALPRLVELDVSANPIVRVARASFEGLGRLLVLRLERLRRLEAVEPRAFLPLRALRSLALELPLGGDRGASLADVTSAVSALETLTVTMRVEALDAQLEGVAAPRLRALEVRGVALRQVTSRAFASLGRQRALTVRVRGTSVTALPAGLARPLARVPLLALDFTDNKLASFSPATLYPNLTDWNRFATKLLPGEFHRFT